MGYEKDQYIQGMLQRENHRCEILAENVWNLPWSLCAKVQRGISVNDEKRELQVTVINKGGTAEFFGPLWGWKILAFFIPYKQRKGEKNYET